jgi:hypothetical protein
VQLRDATRTLRSGLVLGSAQHMRLLAFLRARVRGRTRRDGRPAGALESSQQVPESLEEVFAGSGASRVGWRGGSVTRSGFRGPRITGLGGGA